MVLHLLYRDSYITRYEQPDGSPVSGDSAVSGCWPWPCGLLRQDSTNATECPGPDDVAAGSDRQNRHPPCRRDRGQPGVDAAGPVEIVLQTAPPERGSRALPR